jgi:hypothetical protein
MFEDFAHQYVSRPICFYGLIRGMEILPPLLIQEEKLDLGGLIMFVIIICGHETSYQES